MKSAALKNTSLVVALLTAGAIGGAGVGAFNALHSPAAAAPTVLMANSASGTFNSSGTLPDFPQITEKYGPAVVNI
ncbi:MAG: peptidase, partial [Polaromonas sp.]